MSQFQSLAAQSNMGHNSTRLFNVGRMDGIVVHNTSYAKFKITERLESGDYVEWTTTSASAATVKAAALGYVPGQQLSITMLEKNNRTFSKAIQLNVDQIVYAYDGGSSTSIILYDDADIGLTKYKGNIALSTLLTTLNSAVVGDNYQGVIDCSTNPNYPAAYKDQYYRVSIPGKIGGGSGIDVEAGDVLTCIANTAAGNHAAVGANWLITQTNMFPCTVAVLRTGTDNKVFVSAKTLADQGLTFASTIILALAGGTSNQLALTATGGSKGFSVVSTAQTANDLCTISTTSAVTSAALMKAMDVQLQMTNASTDNMVETARFTMYANVKVGVWANAVCGKIDFGDSGYAVGLAGAVCAEIQLPSGGVPGGAGTYTCFEAEIGMDGVSNSAPISAMAINVWGAQAGDFDDKGYLFDISGVTKATAHIFQDNNNTATQALRIRVNGTPYYILLSDTSD